MFKVGDKVVPISKSCYGGLASSNVWRRARSMGQPFLYVLEVNPIRSTDYTLSEVNSRDTSIGGDYFMVDDLIPFCVNKGCE